MPLTQAEANNLVQSFKHIVGSLTAGSVAGDTDGSVKLDGMLASAERLLHVLAQCGDRLLVLLDAAPRNEEPDTTLTEPGAAPPKRRGRPPTKPPEGTTGVATTLSAAPTVAGGSLENSAAGTQPPAGNGAADPLALPDFLDKSKGAAAASKDDIFGAPGQDETVTAKTYSNADAKQILTAYFDKFGQQRTTALLEATCKVKKFTDLTVDHFAVICPKAEAELAAAK